VTIQISRFETLENKEDVGDCSIPTPGTLKVLNQLTNSSLRIFCFVQNIDALQCVGWWFM